VAQVSTVAAVLWGIFIIGCEAGAPPRLGSLPEGEPAVLEPGYVAPGQATGRPLDGSPSCRRTRRTSASPAIEILSSGGLIGSGMGNMHIWEDGTVFFDGGGCPPGRHRSGKLSPARVRAVIDTLEAAQFSNWRCSEDAVCDDSITTSLTVRRGGTDHTVVETGCESKPTLAAQAIELVMKTVGKNACSPACREDTTFAECR
jgi:hypothetical protein